MARMQSVSPFPPEFAELLGDIHSDAQALSRAVSALFNLLAGCDPAHQVTAGGLVALLEPLTGGIDVLVGDLASARNYGSKS